MIQRLYFFLHGWERESKSCYTKNIGRNKFKIFLPNKHNSTYKIWSYDVIEKKFDSFWKLKQFLEEEEI